MDGTWDRLLTKLLAEADAAGEIDWSVSVDSTINRAHQHGSPLSRETGTGDYTKPLVEPADHALGRSRGGLSTKVHHACDGRGRPLAVLVGRGQAHDGPMLPHVLGAIVVPRPRVGRARSRPDAVLADKAYSSRATRSMLRFRGITAVIPEPRDQQANGKRPRSQGRTTCEL